jgi:glycosyltransferase involved in cell wall biosynthesis
VRDRPRYVLIRRAVERADAIVTCSRWMASQLAAHGIRAEAIDWPVPAPDAAFERRPAPYPSFLYAGRLSVEKGLDVLLRAFARTLAAAPVSRLRVLGDGPARPGLEALARRLGVAGSVEFAGAVPRRSVETGFETAWALVAPSLWAEPLGLVAPESIVHGVPAIATAGGGFAETIEEGVTGRLVPAGDDAAFAAALREVASGTPLAVPAEAVDRARAKHDVGRHVESIERLLAEARLARFGTSLTPSAPRRLNPS